MLFLQIREPKEFILLHAQRINQTAHRHLYSILLGSHSDYCLVNLTITLLSHHLRGKLRYLYTQLTCFFSLLLPPSPFPPFYFIVPFIKVYSQNCKQHYQYTEKAYSYTSTSFSNTQKITFSSPLCQHLQIFRLSSILHGSYGP